MFSMADRLVERVSLGREEIDFLRAISTRTERYRRRDLVVETGDPVNEAFILNSGWAMTFSVFPDGSRQVRRLHFPGDWLCLPAMAMKKHPASVEAITDIAVAPVGKSVLAMLVGRYPRLSAVMFLFAQEERITSGDRLCSLGRQACEARMAFLLMDVLTRLRAVDRSVRASFPMHLSREQMAEVTGMTPVHASRVWTNLLRRNVIACDGNGVLTVLDEAYLQQVSGYINRSVDLDLNWLTASCPAALAAPA